MFSVLHPRVGQGRLSPGRAAGWVSPRFLSTLWYFYHLLRAQLSGLGAGLEAGRSLNHFYTAVPASVPRLCLLALTVTLCSWLCSQVTDSHPSPEHSQPASRDPLPTTPPLACRPWRQGQTPPRGHTSSVWKGHRQAHTGPENGAVLGKRRNYVSRV